MSIAAYIDHTILKPTTTMEDIVQLCQEAAQYGCAAVCVPPPFVRRAKSMLHAFPVQVATVIGFPFGYSATEAKMAEVVLAIVDGVDELDMVINLTALKAGDWEFLEREVKLLVEVIHNKQKSCKLIIESGVLSNEEIIACAQKLGPLGIDFMKTSTGYAEKGATVEAVALMRKYLPAQVRIKASGGIRDYETAKAMVQAGADRLGCSATAAIVQADPSYTESPAS
jgi:deoxyribose-phosphate aldolase